MVDVEQILEKIKEMEDKLSENPDIKKYQDQIDLALEGVQDSEKRIRIIMAFIVSKYNELLNACNNFYKEFININNHNDFKNVEFKDEFVGDIMWKN